MMFLLAIFIFIFTAKIFSQQIEDTLKYIPLNDTLKTISDTIRKGDIDAIVEYSASDSAVFDISNDKLLLYNNAELIYKEYNLKAARIILYKETAVMEAFGAPDSIMEGKYTGLPIFTEGSKRYDAFKIKYNFQTRKGTIDIGSTVIEGGYYLGEKIKKVDDNVYFIENGRYTTCDKSDPDYYFGSPKLKVIQGDKVIAKPVFLYIEDVPIFALPFGIFPNHSGRSSGIIPPAYGEDPLYGRYLSHLGYFWAVNDYLDIALQGNYFTKGRIDLSSRMRYVLRYKLSGNIEIGGSRIRLGEENDNDKIFSDEWRIAVFHNQTINPTTSLNANVNFLSSKNYYNTSTNNLNDLLRQNALSNVTLNKFWEGTPNSVSINYSRDQNLTTGEISQVIPSIIFNRSQTFPFRSKKTSLLDLKWYEQISYSYNGQLQYKDQKLLINSAENNGNFYKNSRGGVKHIISINAAQKIYEFTFTPFFNYNEVWYNKSIEKNFNPADSTVSINEISGFKSFRFFNTGLSLSTRLIGIFNTKIFSVKGIRHTIVPSVTYIFQPDFSKPNWNAYKTYFDQSGREIKYSIFEKEVFGGAPSGEQQALNFSVGNVFEMKIKDTDTTDKKFQLLNLSAGINYNFAADSLKFSELGISYRTQIGDFLNIGGSASFNLYKYKEGVGRVNTFLWNDQRKLAQLTNFNISLSTYLQGGEFAFSKKDTISLEEELVNYDETEYTGIYSDKPINFSIPWSISLSYNYSINKSNPSVINKLSNLSANLNFSLTRNWKFTVTAGYDIFQKQFTTPYITIYRDLHCWEMSFNWVPTGIYRGYKFELRIKAPQLHDIKITKQTNTRGVY